MQVQEEDKHWALTWIDWVQRVTAHKDREITVTATYLGFKATEYTDGQLHRLFEQQLA